MLFFLCIFLSGTTYLTTKENENQARRSAKQVLSQTAAYLEYKTESVGNLLYLLATNSLIKELLERKADYYLEDIGRWPIDSQSFDKILYSLNINPDISAIRFYMKYGLASVFRNDTYIPLQEIEGTRWYGKLTANNRWIHWFFDESSREAETDRYIHVVKGIFGSQSVNELIGIVQFDIPVRVIRLTLDNAILTESTFSMLINREGDVICSSGSRAKEGDPYLRDAGRFLPAAFSQDSWVTVKVNGDRFLLGTESIENSDWVLALILPYRDIILMSARPIRQMLIVFLLIIPLTLSLALLVSHSATKRIHNLIKKMDKVVQGDFSVVLNPQNNDEIGQLTKSFNYMISEIDRLVEERYSLGKEVKHLELKALQAQINPHFLYNTLDLINWMSIRYEAEEIRTIVGALSKFYRLSLGGGEDTVTVRDELEHVKTYVQIQNLRYEDNIKLIVDVPPALQGCQMLKLVIQPLVENAISHGIMLKEMEAGTVRIRGKSEDGILSLHVEDDGVGMSDEKSRRILSSDGHSENHHGYGVRNIHERLRLNYGERFGLSYRSAPGEGTTVTIKIPVS